MRFIAELTEKATASMHASDEGTSHGRPVELQQQLQAAGLLSDTAD